MTLNPRVGVLPSSVVYVACLAEGGVFALVGLNRLSADGQSAHAVVVCLQ